MSKKVVYDIEYEFTVDSFNQKLTDAEKLKVEWAWKKEGGTIQYFPTKGKTGSDGKVKKSVTFNKNLVGHKVYIMPFLEKPDPKISIVVEIVEPIFLYLLYYVSGYHHGDSLMAEAAQSRLQNIKESDWYDEKKHKVHAIPIQDLAEIITITEQYINRYGGKEIVFCKESGIFCHSGGDGPIGSVPSTVEHLDPIEYNQMKISGWSKIEFNWWMREIMFVVYGCNSASTTFPNNFALNLAKSSNFLDSEVWGQSTSSFPSFFPDIRVTSMARNMGIGWFAGKTYMVGGNEGEGWKSTSGGGDLSKFPKANPMNCYKNGTHIRAIHQGYFNDHRK